MSGTDLHKFICPLPNGTVVALSVDMAKIRSGATFHKSSKLKVVSPNHLDFQQYEGWLIEVMKQIADSTGLDIFRIIRRPNANKYYVHVLRDGSTDGPFPYGMPIHKVSDFGLPTSPASPFDC